MKLQNYQNFIEMTSNMIHIVALGVGLKCPRKIHLNTQCRSTITLVVSLIETAFYTFQRTRCLVKLAFRQFLAALHHPGLFKRGKTLVTLEKVQSAAMARRTVGQIPQKCKETSHLM